MEKELRACKVQHGGRGCNSVQEAKRRREKRVVPPGCERVSQSTARHIQGPTELACWPPSDAVS